ncbi:MAG: DUF2797 domain-containing protein [Flavobacteriales bacterium]|nr:DUF2797 domain-containing protein [Flavobacteriales bacterium]
MKFSGNLRKMNSRLEEVVQYELPLYDILEPADYIPMNGLIGKEVSIHFEDAIHCVVTGEKIKKTFGEGMSYEAYMNSPLAVESIINPELSRIHEGIALRDMEWEKAHHLQPHAVYLSNTSGLKVGVTRETQIPIRWIDQGAVQAIVIANTPYRQAAGLIEVSLKGFLADKTNWQQMLKGNIPLLDLERERMKYQAFLGPEFEQWFNGSDKTISIQYPVLQYPEVVKSMKLDKMPNIQGVLTGIKGQYLYFDYKNVINIRSHSGYRVSVEY